MNKYAYILSFDRDDNLDYKSVHEKITSLGSVLNWFHYIKSSYILMTYYSSAKSFAEKIYEIFPDKDFLLVELNLNNRQGWLHKDAWEWINRQCDRSKKSLVMEGPYPLNEEEIDKHIEKNKIGNYAYGHVDEEGSFIVAYVGRSDSCLNTRIRHGISQYDSFKFSYANSVKEAFEKECINYHEFGGKEELNNEIHPARPEGQAYDCPVEDCTEL